MRDFSNSPCTPEPNLAAINVNLAAINVNLAATNVNLAATNVNLAATNANLTKFVRCYKIHNGRSPFMAVFFYALHSVFLFYFAWAKPLRF